MTPAVALGFYWIILPTKSVIYFATIYLAHCPAVCCIFMIPPAFFCQPLKNAMFAWDRSTVPTYIPDQYRERARWHSLWGNSVLATFYHLSQKVNTCQITDIIYLYLTPYLLPIIFECYLAPQSDYKVQWFPTMRWDNPSRCFICLCWHLWKKTWPGISKRPSWETTCPFESVCLKESTCFVVL